MRYGIVKGIYFLLVGSIIAVTGCCNSQQPATQEQIASIADQKISELQKVLMAGDLTQRMDFYDQNASLSPDGFPIIEGKANIEEFLARGMAMASFSSLEFETRVVGGNREYIHQMGIMNSEIIVNDSLVFDNSSKFFYLWKLQEDNSYRMVAEVYNTKDEDED